MKDYIVPIAVQSDLYDRVNVFNEKELPRACYKYYPDARGKFIYLGRLMPNGTSHRLGRLTYARDTECMEFAIFKYSTGRYDSKEKLFPGAEHLDGTIEGALKALTKAYS
jgi:hypothetical protein